MIVTILSTVDVVIFSIKSVVALAEQCKFKTNEYYSVVVVPLTSVTVTLSPPVQVKDRPLLASFSSSKVSTLLKAESIPVSLAHSVKLVKFAFPLLFKLAWESASPHLSLT